MFSTLQAAPPPRLMALRSRLLTSTRAHLHLRPTVCSAAPAQRTSDVPATTDAGKKLKTIADLPGPSVSTTLYWLFAQGYMDRSHLLQGLQKSLYGPIWQSKFGPFELVNLASPELIAQVIQQEGQYPTRTELPHWKEYLDLRGKAYGLHVNSGPGWHRLRNALNPKMLKPQEVVMYAPLIHQVVGDLLQRIDLLRRRSPDQATVSDVAAELYKFGFEGISAILFESRLGCLQEEIPRETLRFIAAVNDMLKMSEVVVIFPHWTRSILPFWRRFIQAWDVLFEIAGTLIDSRVSELEGQIQRGEPTEGKYLTYLLSMDQLSLSEVYITVTELLLGGVDTTSNTLSWSLYHLARDQRVQDRLHQEVSAVCPDLQEPNVDHLQKMPYLRAVIKETLRLYPVVPGNGRFITENEVILDNYWFPKKTLFHLCHYTICRDESEFVNPDSFIPERWLRLGKRAGAFQHHPYSYIPFGVGTRACVGKRVAEMEMHFALTRLLQMFKIEPVDDSVIEPKTRTLLIPDRPVNLRFLPRIAGSPLAESSSH
ncbi:sterol 26-hydroxylase, mitochondrial [Synchiropus picturatus]